MINEENMTATTIAEFKRQLQSLDDHTILTIILEEGAPEDVKT